MSLGNCDICGKEKTWCDSLTSCYSTKEINSICEDCNIILSKKLSNIREIVSNIQTSWIKRAIKILRGNYANSND